jgi:alcohol dehydrogenase (cytochrome c)
MQKKAEHFCTFAGMSFDEMFPRAMFRPAAFSSAIIFSLTLALLPGAARTQTPLRALGDWPLPAYAYDGNRYVETDAITPANVKRLHPAWQVAIPEHTMMEAAPIESGGVLYVSTANDVVYAIDARTGARKWTYAYPLKHYVGIAANRGVALLDGKVFFGTLDAHVVALDAQTGHVVWDVVGAHDTSDSYYTMAPVPFRNTILIGVSNGDTGGNGYITAFDAATGKRVWEWTTIPKPGEAGSKTWAGDSWKRGGGAVWGGLAIDPQNATVYIDVGNPQPDLVGTKRAGANLYTCSMVALDISGSTPKIKWYFQYIPHDTHDWDAAMPPVLFTGIVKGKSQRLVAAADKRGTFWVLDADRGTLLEKIVVSTQMDPVSEPTLKGAVACPGANGGVQYNGGAYSPQTNAFYVPSSDQCQVYTADGEVAFVPGQLYLGGKTAMDGASRGWMSAVDIGSGTMKWRKALPVPALGGALVFSSGVVFTGQLSGDLEAYDANDGAVLWRAATGRAIKAPTSAYAIDGHPYVVVGSGWPGENFELPGVPSGNDDVITAFTM